MDDKGIIICPKCGNEMKAKDRFCFHCGYINYDNEKNDFLVDYDKKAQKILKKEEKQRAKEEKKNKFINQEEKKPPVEKKNFYRSIEEYRAQVEQNVEKTADEKKNGVMVRVNRVGTFILFVAVVIVGYFFISYEQEIYIKKAESVVDLVKEKYGDKLISKCKNDDEYLFAFSSHSLKEEHNFELVSPYLNSEFNGYVLVTKVNDQLVYKVAISDGTFGIRERNVDELKKMNVLPYYNVLLPSVTTSCE